MWRHCSISIRKARFASFSAAVIPGLARRSIGRLKARLSWCRSISPPFPPIRARANLTVSVVSASCGWPMPQRIRTPPASPSCTAKTPFKPRFCRSRLPRMKTRDCWLFSMSSMTKPRPLKMRQPRFRTKSGPTITARRNSKCRPWQSYRPRNQSRSPTPTRSSIWKSAAGAPARA
ncbi:hypothetical protein D3C87_1332540 [compost metagenome]